MTIEYFVFFRTKLPHQVEFREMFERVTANCRVEAIHNAKVKLISLGYIIDETYKSLVQSL